MSTSYIKHPNSLYRGNPLIEGLGYPLTHEDLVSKCRIPYVNELNLEDVEPKHRSFYQRTAFDNLIRFHEPRDELYRLYDIQRRMIESGLVNRNPLITLSGALGSAKILDILNAIQMDFDESISDSKNNPGAKNPIRSMNIKKFGFHEQNHSFVLAGLSGAGKTTLVEHINKCEKMVIVHTKYTDPTGITHSLPMKQIYKLYLKVSNRKGQKAILISILEAVDALIDEDYSEMHANSDVRQLIAAVRKVSVIHGIGLIIFDEAQNLAPPAQGEAIGANERVSMKFLEEIFNTVAVPTLFVGTFSMLKLLTKEATVARRAAKDGSLLIASCAVDSPFWDRFCKILFQTSYLGNQVTSFETFKFHIHSLSAGLPAIAVSLTKATLNFLTFLSPKNQDLSIAALDKIYELQFEVLHKPLMALRSNSFAGYEDFEPMYMLESVEKNMKNEFQSASKVQEIENLISGDLKLKKDLPQEAKKNEHDKKLRELGNKIKPDSILANLMADTCSDDE